MSAMGRSLALLATLALISCNEDDAYTVADCEADGGTVVTSIGDEFPMCPSGSATLGRVTTKDGKPVATEGAICCGM